MDCVFVSRGERLAAECTYADAGTCFGGDVQSGLESANIAASLPVAAVKQSRWEWPSVLVDPPADFEAMAQLAACHAEVVCGIRIFLLTRKICSSTFRFRVLV